MDHYEKVRQEDLETMGEYEVTVAMTKKQDKELRLLAYEAGYDNPADLLNDMIRDLTGWGGNTGYTDGMNRWYKKTYSGKLLRNYFRHYLYENCDMDRLNEMIQTPEEFEVEYQWYLKESRNMLMDSRERCLEVVKEIYEAGGYE